MMYPYTRRVFYYETDNMGIVHHSNYIRWMEEARLDYMRQAGLSYSDLEAAGIIMPVISIDCRYLVSAHFDEEVIVTVKPASFNGVRAAFAYAIQRKNDAVLLAEGHSSHCFLDGCTRKPLNLKRRMPEYSSRYEKIITGKE